MSLTKRMAAIVGDENTVGRYLLEKAGHTALIACVIVAGSLGTVSLLTAASLATALYVAVGKTVWYAQHRGRVDVRDLAFDTLVSAIVVVLALFTLRLEWALAALAVWIVLFLVLDNNAWGSPS